MDSAGKKLGFVSTLGIALGTTIGAGVFAFTGVAAGQAGPLLPYAYALAVVPVMFAMAPVAMMAAALPAAGGNYQYPSRLLSPELAFMAVWLYAFGAFWGFFPLYSLSCVDYLQTYFPNLPPGPTAGAILTLFYLMNIRGVSVAAGIEAALVGVLIIALILYAALGLGHIESANLQLPAPHGLGGLAGGAALLTFAYMGSNALIEMGHEIDRPARNIPLAIGLCLVIITILYISVGFVTVGAAPYTVSAGKDLANVARGFMGSSLLAFFVFGGALAALGTTINASFLWGTKSLQVLCNDGFLPKGWGANHPRWGTPARLLTGIYLLSLLGLALPLSRETLSAFSTLGGLGIFIPVMITAMVLPKQCPKAYAAARFKLKGPLLFIAPTVGVLLCLGAMVTLLMELVDWTGMLLYAIWAMVGFIYLLKTRGKIKLERDPEWV